MQAIIEDQVFWLERPMKLLKIVGLKPKEHKRPAHFVAGTAIFLTICSWLLVIRLMFEQNIYELIANLKSMMIFFNIFPIMVIYKENELDLIFQDFKTFWKDPEYVPLLQNIKTFFFWFEGISWVVFLLYLLYPLTDHKLGFDMYIPEGYYYLVFLIQYLPLQYDYFIATASFSLFVWISVLMTIQFKIVNKKLRILTFDSCNSKLLSRKILIECIEHQKMLYRNVDRLCQSYYHLLLIQYMLSILSLCTALISFQNLKDYVEIMSSFGYLGALMFQLGLYCFPSDYLIVEASEVGEAVYECSWYDDVYISKTFVQPLIMRSQKEIQIAAGGMIFMNRRTYTQILKVVLSVYTFMNDVMAKH